MSFAFLLQPITWIVALLMLGVLGGGYFIIKDARKK